MTVLIGGTAIFGFLTLALAIYVAVDAAKYPEWAFERSGSRKNMRVAGPLVLWLFCGIGALAMSIHWLITKKHELEDATAVSPGFGMNFAYAPPTPVDRWTPEQGGAAPPSWGAPPPETTTAPTPTEPVPPPPTEPPPPPPPAGR